MSGSIAKPDVEPTDIETFHSRSMIGDAMSGAGISAAGGLFFSAMQNALSEHKQGAAGVFTRTGSSIALFAAMGGAFSASTAAAANAREKDDSLNGAIGGCAAGLVAGAGLRSVPMMFGSCATLAALIGTFDKAGKSLAGAYGTVSPNSAHTHGVALEGAQVGHEFAGAGETGWRNERERRRTAFFKKRPAEDASSE